VYRRGKTRASKRRAPSGLAGATRENGHVIAQALMLSCDVKIVFVPRCFGAIFSEANRRHEPAYELHHTA
jgi:hypothetical protein